MTIGERIEQRRKAIGIRSQSELARRADMRQSTLNGLIRNPYRWSPYLPRIARELGTTVEYLVGEVDDADLNAAPVPNPPQRIMLEVVLPSEDLLTAMFEGVLLGVDRDLPLGEQARTLAQSLPIGLARLQGARAAPDRPAPATPADAPADPAFAATHDPGALR